MEENIKKVYDILKTSTKHIEHRQDNLENRIKFATTLRTYIKNVEKCLTISDKTISLYNDDKTLKLIQFKKRIGSKSKYGMAYLNSGYGKARILRFSIKVLEYDRHSLQELDVLRKVTKLVESMKTPHLPLVYKILYCNDPCIKSACPKLIRDKQDGYFLVLNELANYDLKTFLKESHEHEILSNILAQIMISIYNIHLLKVLHTDCHLGNFLLHEVKEGGYWHYNILGRDFYLPNLGYQVVLWDFGLSENVQNVSHIYFEKDFKRVLGLLNRVHSFSTSSRNYAEMPSETYALITRLIHCLYKYNLESEFMNEIIDILISEDVMQTKRTSRSVLNKKPFVLI